MYKILIAFTILVQMAFAFDIRPQNYSGKVKFIKQERLNYNFKDA